jgi:sialate O-acetylesterase
MKLLLNLRMSVFAAVMLVVLVCGGQALHAAELRLSRHLTGNMVLQQGKPIRICGVADQGAEVTVAFAGQQKKVMAGTNGEWLVILDPMPADAKPRELTASSSRGGKPLSVANILVGDVFLFARQTSIDISLGRDKDGKAVAASHKANPLLRSISIKTLPARFPQSDLAAGSTEGWSEISQESALKMSAAAYYLGNDLAGKLDVPVGIIDLNLGPAFPVSWLSREALLETEKFYGKSDVPGLVKRLETLADLVAKGEPLPRKEGLSSDPLKYVLYPAGGYNAVLNPLKGLGLKGILVQLGNDYPYVIYGELEKNGKHLDREELNDAYVSTYDIRKVGFRMEPVTTPRISREWRKVFADDELPVGLVVPPGSALLTQGMHGVEMRELQRLAAEANSGVGVILPGSESVIFSSQPRDEALLAGRCLSWVLGSACKRPGIAATGPLYARLESSMNKATLYFKEGTSKGLHDLGKGLTNFEAAGVDGVYSPAEALIDGEVIRITSKTVNRIVHVRYDWQKQPAQGLVNEAGLPAMPFRTQKAEYDWFQRNEESDLPLEYSTPANEWKGGDVTLVNGQLKTHGYGNHSGWLGPVGIRVGPFGPNMGVRQVLSTAPAAGKLFEGDIIYSANGTMLGEQAQKVMAAAITWSETEEGKGKLVLGVRRAGKNLDNIGIPLAVMGTFSSTAPYDCPKSEKIVSNLEAWLVARGGDEGFLGTDTLFLLAAGTPKYQGLVRRVIYNKISKMDPSQPIDPTKGRQAWFYAWDSLLLGEYYFATGDRTVLPYLKYNCDVLAAKQHAEGGWRHNFPGGENYGLLPPIGVTAMMGFVFAKEAGLEINQQVYERAMTLFQPQAAAGTMIYGTGIKGSHHTPSPIDPAALENGMLASRNGGVSAGGILFKMVGDTRTAHLCSLISTYSFNNTHEGHGGNFWNNFWTPLGAFSHSRAAFIHFMKGYRWYSECNRMFDGSLISHAEGGVGAGAGMAYVAPRQRLRIVGAPKSPFAVDAPEFLKPALAAHAEKDYARCEALATAVLESGAASKDERPTVEALVRIARETQESVAADLDKMEALMAQGKPYEASLDVAPLKSILPAGNQRLAAIETALKAAGTNGLADDKKRYDAVQAALVSVTSEEKSVDATRKWECLVTEIKTSKSKDGAGKVSPEQASKWRLNVVEDPVQAPAGWTKPAFDDATWNEVNLPISWRMYHTALLRTKFTVKDKNDYDGLRLRGWFFRQQGIEIILNGELVAKVNNLEEKTGDVEAEFNESVMKKLRTGENTLAISTRHNWRWGMLFMNVYNDGFGFRLDARLKKKD